MPVYTAVFVDEQTPDEEFPQFYPIPKQRFKLLVPRALIENFPDREKKICGVDDVVLTGKTMDALRAYLDRLEPKPACVVFGCHFCNDNHTTFTPELAPKHNVARSEKKVRIAVGTIMPLHSKTPLRPPQKRTYE